MVFKGHAVLVAYTRMNGQHLLPATGEFGVVKVQIPHYLPEEMGAIFQDSPEK